MTPLLKFMVQTWGARPDTTTTSMCARLWIQDQFRSRLVPHRDTNFDEGDALIHVHWVELLASWQIAYSFINCCSASRSIILKQLLRKIKWNNGDPIILQYQLQPNEAIVIFQPWWYYHHHLMIQSSSNVRSSHRLYYLLFTLFRPTINAVFVFSSCQKKFT